MAALGTTAVTFLLALVSVLTGIFAMVETLWESFSQGHNIRESKDMDMKDHRKPLVQCALKFTEHWNTSFLQEKDILLIKPTYLGS